MRHADVRLGSFTPWEPTDETVLVEVYDRYNVPLAGLLQQGADLYCFECKIGREGGDLMVYSLVAVTQDEVDQINKAKDFDAVFAHVTAGKPALAVVYSDDRGIFQSILIESPASYEAFAAALLAAVRSTQQALELQISAPVEHEHAST